MVLIHKVPAYRIYKGVKETWQNLTACGSTDKGRLLFL